MKTQKLSPVFAWRAASAFHRYVESGREISH
jgi:hypothetical protein